MQVILLERVEKLGQMGDTVNVKPGFARNFLLPTKKALRATKENLERFEADRSQLEANNLDRKTEAAQVDDNLSGMTVVVIRAASESGQLYGSVTARDIADAVTLAGVTVDRGQVLMERPIKTLGIFDFRIRLHPEVTSEIKINVAQSEEEAEAQADRVARGEDAVMTAAKADRAEGRRLAEEQATAMAAAAGFNEDSEDGGDGNDGGDGGDGGDGEDTANAADDNADAEAVPESEKGPEETA